MAAHHWPLRVYYEDTDFSGLVYHASYLRFLERGRTEWLRALGVDQAGLFAESAVVLVVRAMVIDFRQPARMDDCVVVETRSSDVTGARIVLDQRVVRDTVALVTARVTIAAVSGGRARRLPPGVASRLTVRGTSP